MKRFFYLVILLFVCNTYTNAYADDATYDSTILSEFSDEECINFLLEHGVNIPSEYLEEASFGDFAKSIIKDIEENPNWENVFNLTSTRILADEIKAVVNDYYGTTQTYYGLSTYSSRSTSSVSLVDSVASGTWQTGWPGYNCYAYAISQYSSGSINPGYRIGATVTIKTSAESLASMAGYDLRDLGYSDALYYSSRPSYVPSGKKLICVRKGTYDYHFMRCAVSTWYHKPGQTAVLKYKYQPTYSRVWTNEAIINSDGTVRAGTITYDSAIFYIMY